MTTIKFFNTGFCTSLEKFVIKTAPWRCCKFPALFSLIKHPVHGNILFDTGHSSRFFQLTNKFPMFIYRWLVHVEHESKLDAATQLIGIGVRPEDINYIIISHFHADHIGSLCDFPNAKFIYKKSAYDAVKNLNYFSALKAGFLSGLLPDDFEARSICLNDNALCQTPDEYSPFHSGYNIFGDNSILAVDLPGHADGHIGIFVKITEDEKYFLVADACWKSESYRSLTPPHNLSFLIMKGKDKYMQTLNDIHLLSKNSPGIRIVPSHCQDILDSIN